MVNQSREKFFQKLSKRELQFLCRNLGIPFGQRKDLLANTLAALPEHYFDSKYRSSQATFGLSNLQHNSPVLGYNGGPVQSYANFARYSLGHDIPNNQFTDINSSSLGVEAMNMESAITRDEKYLNPEYGSAHAQSVPQYHQDNFDSSGLQLPENTRSHLNFAGYVQTHKMPTDHFNKLHISPSASGIRKKREEYFLSLPKKQLISLCRKIQLPLTSTKCGLARNLAAMPECYFDADYRVDFDANGLSSQRPSKEDSSFIRCRGETNLFHSQLNDINVRPLLEGTVNIESMSKSKEVNAYRLADTSCFQPVLGYGKGVYTNQEIADTSSRVVPPRDKDGFPDNVRQCDGSASKTYDSATTTKANSPSFEFHVRSDEGINLFVDLNSNLSSWVESLSRDVHITERSSSKKDQTFQEEIVHFAESKLQNKSTLSATTHDHKISTANEVPKGNEESQFFPSSVPDFNAEIEIPVARPVDKVKVDSFNSLHSVSMSEDARALAMIEQPSNLISRGCYRCSFWPYGCDKCSTRGSLEMKTQGKTSILTSEDKDGDVPKALDGATSLVLSKVPSKLAPQSCYRCFCWSYGCETCSMSGGRSKYEDHRRH